MNQPNPDLLDWQIPPSDRQRAIERMRRQFAEWDLAMPQVAPLVLDFGLGRFDQTGLIELWLADEHQAGYCGKYMFVFDGQQCPTHRHITKHETFVLIKGRLKVMIEGESFTMNPGDIRPITPGLLHSFKGKEPSLLLELSMPCVVSDNQFADDAINQWLRRFVAVS